MGSGCGGSGSSGSDGSKGVDGCVRWSVHMVHEEEIAHGEWAITEGDDGCGKRVESLVESDGSSKFVNTKEAKSDDEVDPEKGNTFSSNWACRVV